MTTQEVLTGTGKPERKVFITHHTPDIKRISVEMFSSIAQKLQELGFSEHRFDIRGQQWAPSQSERNTAYIRRSASLAKAALDKGLSPIIILSTPPKWALRDKSMHTYTRLFEEQARTVKKHFEEAQVPVQSVQILNELNNPVYTPKQLIKHLPRMTQSVRDVFGPDTDVSATMVLAKPWIHIEKFMEKYHHELSPLTTLGLDFYPAIYQMNRTMLKPRSGKTIARQALEAYATNGMKNARPDFLALLHEQATDVHTFKAALDKARFLFPQKNLDLGEFGFPTIEPLQKRNPNHEKLQTLFIKKIAKAIQPVLHEANVRKVGFYQLMDDKELGVLNWGIFNDKGEAKQIVSHLPQIIQSLKA